MPPLQSLVDKGLGMGKITGTEEPNRNRTKIFETGTGLIPLNTRMVPIFLYLK